MTAPPLTALPLMLAMALGLAGCKEAPLPAHPALWSVTDRQGHEGWLFGTVHSAPGPLDWHSATIDAALGRARTIMVEVGNLRDDAAVAATFAQLAKTTNAPPLTQRVSPADRKALLQLMERGGMRDSQFAQMDTWAAALMLARNADADTNAENGVDRAILGLAHGRPVHELEGAEKQLGIFDQLPEREQRDLLAAVVRDASATSDLDLVELWRAGDMEAIAAETRKGMLADPELREALYTARNRAWLTQIEQAIRNDRRPFVAVGAAHMAGNEGLVTLLQRAGYTVRRIQ